MRFTRMALSWAACLALTLSTAAGMPVADLGGIWSNVQIWHNTITSLGGHRPVQPAVRGGQTAERRYQRRELQRLREPVHGR